MIRWMFIVVVVLVCLPCRASDPIAQPNVVLFLVDDMGWMDSSVYGSKYYSTPNMERLARRAMRFTNAYATPLCSPTRASILSGQHAARHGTTTASGHQAPQPPGHRFRSESAPPNRALIQPQSKNYLDPAQFTLAESLRQAGYRTGHFGKWHLGLTPDYWPNRQGFETIFHCAPDPGPPSYFSPYGVVNSGRPAGRQKVGNITDGPSGEYITDRLTDEAIKFIEQHRDEPFYLNLWQYGVHGPWGHKPEYTAEFAKKTDPRGLQRNPIMASMLQSVDESLGRVIDTLDALGLTERTVFIFYSDNGGNVHSNVPGTAKTLAAEKSRPEFIADWRRWAGDEPPTNNSPLRAGKGSLYEGGCRVPLMVSWPGAIEPGTTSDALVAAVDLYPTVLELLKLTAPKEQILDGESCAKVLRGGSPPADRAVFNYFPHGTPNKPAGVWVRRGDWKLIRWFETGPDYPDLHELYDLNSDIGESYNLALEHPARVKELDAMIDQFFADTQALIPIPNPAYDPTTAATNRAFGGWVPKGCTVDQRDGMLVVTPKGRRPFLAKTGLRLPGPVTLTLRYRGAGPSAVQWRTADQSSFPADGQTISFQLDATDRWAESQVKLPVSGTLQHIRLSIPETGIQLDRVRMVSDRRPSEKVSWDFE